MLKFQEISNFVHLVSSDEQTPWKCNGLLIKCRKGRSVVIDCNFKDEDLKNLLEFAGSKPERYYITHVHVDHVLNVHRIEKLNIPVFCPSSEKDFMLDVDQLIKKSGAQRYGVFDEMKSFLFKFAGHRNIRDVKTYDPVPFVMDNIKITPIHLPGHSPGHCGFIIKDLSDNNRPILFSTDMGIEKIGAWYGFEYCDVTEIKKSLLKIDEIYQSNNFILTGSHSDILFEKEKDIFKEVEKKIEKSRMKILPLMEQENSLSPDDLVFKGIYYRTSSIEKMDPFTKRLYAFWEGASIRNLFYDLENDGLIEKTDSDRWTLNHGKTVDLLCSNTLKEVFGI